MPADSSVMIAVVIIIASCNNVFITDKAPAFGPPIAEGTNEHMQFVCSLAAQRRVSSMRSVCTKSDEQFQHQ